MAPIHPEGAVNGFVLDENGELDFTELEQEYAVPHEDGFDTVIVVDNCPIVGEDPRKQKLILFIRRIFSTNGTIKEDGIYMPMKEDEETGKLTSQGYFEFQRVLTKDMFSLNMLRLNKLQPQSRRRMDTLWIDHIDSM
jgi:hypothetical protein